MNDILLIIYITYDINNNYAYEQYDINNNYAFQNFCVLAMMGTPPYSPSKLQTALDDACEKLKEEWTGTITFDI